MEANITSVFTMGSLHQSCNGPGAAQCTCKCRRKQPKLDGLPYHQLP